MGELIEHNPDNDFSALADIPASLNNRQKLALAAYKTTGQASKAAIAAGVTLKTLRRWLKEVPELADGFELVDTQLTDMLEEVLIDEAKSGSFPHLQMELKARNREKYDRPQKVDVDQNVTINVQRFGSEQP